MCFFSKNERFQVVLGFGDQFGEEMGLEQSNPNYITLQLTRHHNTE